MIAHPPAAACISARRALETAVCSPPLQRRAAPDLWRSSHCAAKC